MATLTDALVHVRRGVGPDLFSVMALGLDEPEDPTAQTPYALMLQKLARFLLEYLHTELQPLPAGPPLSDDDLPRSVADLFGMRTSGVDRCLQCGQETMRESTSLVVDLTVVRKVRSPRSSACSKP